MNSSGHIPSASGMVWSVVSSGVVLIMKDGNDGNDNNEMVMMAITNILTMLECVVMG